MDATSTSNRIPVNIEDEMRQSYMDYAMSVIIGRALPDARDGLKPVHRRVLYAMYDLGNDWNRAYKKSARVVGDVIGKYHPHGDSAVYDTIVRMAQDFSLRYPLVDGQGNFGSVDGDPPAAMRYTEIRMARIAERDAGRHRQGDGRLHAELRRDAAASRVVLPARIPNLLVNGSSGIAVGMATNIPPHNLGEIVDGTGRADRESGPHRRRADAARPRPGLPDRRLHPRPRRDPRGLPHRARRPAAAGPRASTEIDKRTGRAAIIVNEIPYQVNKARLIERIAELVNEKRIEGISDLRDESDRDGMRIVIELKRDAMPEVVLNQLYKLTPMQESFGIIMLAIVDGRPKLLNLKEALQVFIEHRKEVVTRRTVFELRKAEERLHILEGLKIALDHLDAVIAADPRRPGPCQRPREGLMQQFRPLRAPGPGDPRHAPAAPHRPRARQDPRGTRRDAAADRPLPGDPRRRARGVQDHRRRAAGAEGACTATRAAPRSSTRVSDISHRGHDRRRGHGGHRLPRGLHQAEPGDAVPRAAARRTRQDRRDDEGGGLRRAAVHRLDARLHPVLHHHGKVYWIKVHELPQAGRAARGKAIVNLLSLEADEKISAFLPVREFQPGHYVLLRDQARDGEEDRPR